MDWTVIEANWRHYHRHVQAQWQKLTNAHIEFIAGKLERLVQLIEELYSMTQAEAKMQISAFQHFLQQIRLP